MTPRRDEHPEPEEHTARRPILVVEDDEDTRVTLRYILEAKGYDVAEAGDGRAALAWLENGSRPCLILLDLMMPVMSGLEFLASFRAQPDHADTPVIVVSAWPERAAETPGIQGFLKKPFNLVELLEQTRRFC